VLTVFATFNFLGFSLKKWFIIWGANAGFKVARAEVGM